MSWAIWHKKKKERARAFAYSALSNLELIAGLHRRRYDTQIKLIR